MKNTHHVHVSQKIKYNLLFVGEIKFGESNCFYIKGIFHKSNKEAMYQANAPHLNTLPDTSLPSLRRFHYFQPVML